VLTVHTGRIFYRPTEHSGFIAQNVWAYVVRLQLKLLNFLAERKETINWTKFVENYNFDRFIVLVDPGTKLCQRILSKNTAAVDIFFKVRAT